MDVISVSLNAPDRRRYDEICLPVYENAFDAVVEFAVSCKQYVPKVIFSVVDLPLTEDEISRCRELADSVGIPLRVRAFE